MTQLDAARWRGLQEELTRRVAALPEQDAIVVAVPEPPRPPRKLFRRAPKPPPTPFAQFLRHSNGLDAECIAPWQLDLSDAPLRALGWEENPRLTGTFIRPFDSDDASGAAAAAVEALALLGTDPALLVIEEIRF